MTKIKICGLTRAEDIDAAVAMGVDAIGFVFYKPSKRYVTVAQAKLLIERVPPFITTVGLFVNETEETIKEILDEVPLSLLQFHGDETPAACAKFRRPYIKAIRVHSGTDFTAIQTLFSSAKGFLLDADTSAFGGSGKTFDWSLIPNTFDKPLILAGGLTVENVSSAISMINPYAVDVSSGVEIQPSIKCHQKMHAFIEKVRQEGK